MLESDDSMPAAAPPIASGHVEAEAPARVADDDDVAEAAEHATFLNCPDLDPQPPSCGQISIKLKGDSSCQLTPTASDLTRLPRTVRFDCDKLVRGPNGYDFDDRGHVTLTGDTCEALQAGGPHRVTLFLACGPSSSAR